MAHQDPSEAVLDEPGVALIAIDLVSACPADRHWSVAAAVQEQEHLFSDLDSLLHGACKSVGNPAIGRQIPLAQVYRPHLRHDRCTKPSRQGKARVLARFGVRPGFEGGSGRRQDCLRIRDRPAQNGHVSSIVDDAFFLLV